DGLVSMLAADAVAVGDSGGVRPSWPNAIIGRVNIGRLFASLGDQLRQIGGTIRLTGVNGQPGARFLAADRAPVSGLALEITDGQVTHARSVINRDKLRHLGPLADLPALLEQARRR